MKRALLSVLLLTVLLSVAGCAEGEVAGLLQSNKPRETSPDIAAADLTDLVDGSSAFAFDLYQAIKEKEGNLFYSPYSISLALAMTYAGARSATEQQMADTLRFTLDQSKLHPAFNSLDLELASRGEGAEGKDDEGFRLNVVNAIWGQKDYEFRNEFLDVLAENYDAGLRLLDYIIRLLDYINAPEASRVTINDWVSDQTEGRIEDLIPQGVIDGLTRLVLTNAIYFNAAWLNPFNEDITDDGAFYLLGGGEATVPMMMQSDSFGYAEGEGYQAVELPYDGRELSMVILLPDTGEFEGFEGSLNADLVDTITNDLIYKEVALTMPKFEFESEFSLADTLAAMGMPVAFTGAADFSGMTGNRDLFIAEVLHKAFVAFIFLIRDIETGAILFVGRVVNPRT
jgi:serpin B